MIKIRAAEKRGTFRGPQAVRKRIRLDERFDELQALYEIRQENE